jgi:ankyrin repeat protein
MKKVFIFLWLIGTGLALVGQHRHFSPDDSFTRQYFKRHYNYSYEERLFNRSWDHLMSTYLITATFSNRLSSVASFQLPTNDPEVLLGEYYRKIDQINASYLQQQVINNAMIDRGIRELGNLVAEYARDNRITTKNAFADLFIKEIAIGTVQEKVKQKNAEKLELQRSDLQATLESNLSSQMLTIRDQMLSDNSQLRDKYFEALVYEADYSKEKYYTSCYEYYKCFYEQIKSDYSYQSPSWYKPNCYTPRMDYSTSGNGRDYIDIAFRKLDLYRKYNNEIFIDGINIFLDAGLAENKQNPKAFLLKAQMEKDIINKMFFTQLALTLDPGNNEYESAHKEISSSFNDEFFLSIRNENVDFISKSIEKGFHLGREKDGQSAIETAIDFDKANILEMLINSTPEEKNTLSENGKGLLFHACAVDALEVVKKLISLGVNPEFKDKNYSGLTALNIAYKNNSEKVFLYLAINYNIKYALLFAKKNGADDLESLSARIYEVVPSKIRDISSVNSKYKKMDLSASSSKNDSENSTKKINLEINNDDSSNLVNNQKKDYLEHDSTNSDITEVGIVEKPEIIKENKSIYSSSNSLKSQKPKYSFNDTTNTSQPSETKKVRVYVTDIYNTPLTDITVYLFSGTQVQKKITDSFGEVLFDAFPRDILKVATADLTGFNKYGTTARKGYTEMLSNIRLKLPRYPASSAETANMFDELVSILLDAPDIKETIIKLKEAQSKGISIPSSETSLGTPGVFSVNPAIINGKAGFLLKGTLVNCLKGNLNCESNRYGINYYSGPQNVY